MAPKWRELADRLAEQIRSGEYAPGRSVAPDQRPGEAGEGSKSTVHQAYKALEAEGLVTSSRGHGTVVRQQTPLKRLGIARYDKAKWRDGDEVAFIADRVASGRTYRAERADPDRQPRRGARRSLPKRTGCPMAPRCTRAPAW